eukprot:2224269-Prymnesium_polylepis.1
MGTRGHPWARGDTHGHVGTHGHAWARMDFQLFSECGRRWALQANSAACGVNSCQAGARTSVPGVCVCVCVALAAAHRPARHDQTLTCGGRLLAERSACRSHCGRA